MAKEYHNAAPRGKEARMNITERRAALLARIRDYGGPLNEPAVFVQFMAQIMHESGGLRYVREIWGPTAAQKRYEGRKDLGNVRAGDGKRFMGRDVLQITGRTNYRALTEWVRKTFGAKVDFEANPELLESPEWLGIGAIWYFLAARPKLVQYCRDGNIEMVTRQVNGGLNGYQDRLRWYDRIALEMLKAPDVRTFQKQSGLVVDGISGPKTRAALHDALSHVKENPVSVTRPAPRVNADPPKKPAQRKSAPQVSAPKKDLGGAAGGAVGGGLVLALVAFADDLWSKFTAFADWVVFWTP